VHAAVSDVNDDLIGNGAVEFPPSSADRIIQFCPTLAHCAEEKGNITEPLWRAMLGVVKYTTEGKQRAHEWSAGHPEYDEAETESKIDRWVKGPTTCDHFRGTSGNRCGGCVRTCTSPIQLGYVEEAPAPAAPVAAAPENASLASPEQSEQIPHWPRGYMWDGQRMLRAVKDSEGQVNWIPFCETLFYPTIRLRNEDETWSLHCISIKRDGKQAEFLLPTQLLGEPNKLAAHLAAQEIVITGVKGKTHMVDYNADYMAQLQRLGKEQLTYAKCGWADKDRSFVLGAKRITATTEDTILPGELIKSAGWNTDLGYSGTRERWIELVNSVYNRPGAEPFQFVIAAAFAAPLVEIADIDNWHGIPIALTGEGGTGKTTASLVGCSIYGRRGEFLRSCTEQGATFNAMIARVGIARNLPMVFDEVTKRDVDDVAAFLYSLSNGRPKDRLTAGGILINQGLNWKTISFVTSNDNITEFLSSTKNRNVSEATQVRCFEIPVASSILDIWNDINALDIIEHKLKEEHGVVGREWLRYVIKNRVELRDEIRNMRAQFSNDAAEGTKERYYRDLVVTVIVALRHTVKLGLVQFDEQTLYDWAVSHIKSLRRSRTSRQYTPEEIISHFLADLQGRVLVTQYFRDGRVLAESPTEPLRGAPLARLATKDNAFVVTTKAVNDWCIENKAQPSWLMEQMDILGYIIHRGDSLPSGARKDRICKGTHLPGAPALVLELEYSKVFGVVGAPAPVVQLVDTKEQKA
jgi:hypothetical protein